MKTFFSFGARFISDAIKVESGDLSNTETTSTIITLGNANAWQVIIPEDMTAGSLKVYAYYGRNESNNDVWVDITNAEFGSATLSSKSLNNSTSKYTKIKLEYTASNDTNHGKAHVVVYAK